MIEVLKNVIDHRLLTKLTLSKSVDKNILRTTGRLVEMKGKRYLALESFYADGKTAQENIPAPDAPEKVASLIPGC